MFELRLKQIIDECENYTLRQFKHAVYPLLEEMKGKIDEKKYNSFKIEYDCVRNECIYGDNPEDANMVKMDCVEALKAILEKD